MIKIKEVKILPESSEVKKFLIIFYAVGIIGFAIPQTQNLFIVLTPWALLMNFILLMYFHRPIRIINYALMALVAFLGFFIEVVGVKTGQVFGMYTYGDVLGPKILETPLMIGLNWLVITYCASIFLNPILKNRLLVALIGAAMVTIFDIIMEPVAIYTGMWSWHMNIIPLKNYLMWFLVSWVFIFLFTGKNVKNSNPLATSILFLQLGFFAALHLIIKIF